MVTTQPPATWTPGMLGTALADNLLSVFIETIDLSVRKRGKIKKIDKFQYESCMKCRCVGRWKTFLEFPCLLSTRAYHRFPYFVFYCEAQGKGKGQVIQKSLKLDINSIQSAV